MYAQYKPQFFHHGDHGENPLEVADAVGAVGGDAGGVVLARDHAHGHHAFQVLLGVVRVQLEGHERHKVGAHRCGRDHDLLFVFVNRRRARHGGHGVRHNDGSAKLAYKVSHIAGHEIALAQVGMKIIG